MTTAVHWPRADETERQFERRLRAEGLSHTAAKAAVAAYKHELERRQRLREQASQRPAPRARLLGGV
jgi:hypothetical protein